MIIFCYPPQDRKEAQILFINGFLKAEKQNKGKIRLFKSKTLYLKVLCKAFFPPMTFKLIWSQNNIIILFSIWAIKEDQNRPFTSNLFFTVPLVRAYSEGNIWSIKHLFLVCFNPQHWQSSKDGKLNDKSYSSHIFFPKCAFFGITC